MEMIKQHILPRLNSFTSEALISINNIFNEIQNESKAEFTEIICYIEHLLNLCYLSTNQGLTSLHIHIENEFDDSKKLLLAEFILIKFHYLEFVNSIEQENNLNHEIQILTNRVNNFSFPVKKSRDYPFGVSTQEYNQITHKHKKNK